MRSKFAQELEVGRRATVERRRSSMAALQQGQGGKKSVNEKRVEEV
jgi:hypothetical protein